MKKTTKIIIAFWFILLLSVLIVSLESEDLDQVCSVDASLLFRYNGTWGCGVINSSNFNITVINENITYVFINDTHLVPYVGASQSLNLGANNLTTQGYIEVKNNAGAGNIYISGTTGGANLYFKENNVLKWRWVYDFINNKMVLRDDANNNNVIEAYDNGHINFYDALTESTSVELGSDVNLWRDSANSLTINDTMKISGNTYTENLIVSRLTDENGYLFKTNTSGDMQIGYSNDGNTYLGNHPFQTIDFDGSTTFHNNVNIDGQLYVNNTELTEIINEQINLAYTNYNATSITNITGKTNNGNLTSIQTIDDSNSYNVSELAGLPGFNIEIEFEGVETFETIKMHTWYMGSAGHTVNVDIQKCSDSSWTNTGTIPDEIDFELNAYEVVSPKNYICGNNNNVTIRIYHSSAGNINHKILIDYVTLERRASQTRDHGSLTGLSDDDHTQYLENNDDITTNNLTINGQIEGWTYIEGHLDTDQLTTTAIYEIVKFNNITYDFLSEYNSTTGNTTIINDGIYRINSHICYRTSTGTRWAFIYLNGQTKSGEYRPTTGGIRDCVYTDRTLKLTSGDIINIKGYQNSGGNLNIAGIAWDTYFSITRIQ